MDRVRLAIVGCGNISQLNAPGYLQHPRCDVVALCDTDPERAKRRAREWGITPQLDSDFAQVLDDSAVDAVELLTPTWMHADQIIAALGAGKHVSAQKPLAVSIAEAERIATAVARAKTVFRVTENFLYYPPILKAKELLDAGVIGEPSLVRIHTTRAQKITGQADRARSERRSANEPVSGIFGVVHDISRKVADERKLIEALGKAREAADAKSNFLATMSHEIRTPMTGVLGMIDLLRENPSEEERVSFLATLKQSASLLMAVLDDVLDFSKMEHGRIEIKPCDFDFEALAQSTLDLFFNAASQKGLLISLALDPGSSPFVHGDPVRIQQVMSNLINNAIKFTDTGSVTVRVKARPAAGNGQLWRIEVRDTGIGIAEDQAALLFDPFTQAEQGTGRRFGGTGLGLAISRQLVERMGGELGFDSKEGQGSCFWFELALDEAQSVPARTRPPTGDPPGARARRAGGGGQSGQPVADHRAAAPSGASADLRRRRPQSGRGGSGRRRTIAS